MTRKLLDYYDISQCPTVRVPVVARLHGPMAQEARAIMYPHETPDHLFMRLLCFWQWHARQDSDTALIRAYARVEREAR